MRSSGDLLGQDELGDVAKRDLERGLKSMAGDADEGIGCIPVWLDDQVHTSECHGRRPYVEKRLMNSLCS